MGNILAFKRPLGLPASARPSPRRLAEEFYHQCHVHAVTTAFDAKRQNPALDLNRLVPSLTRHFTEELIAYKLFEAAAEINLEKLKIAEHLQDLMDSPRPKNPALAGAR